MERNREAKRGSLAAVNGNGLSRRQHRITALRDSAGEDGQRDVQETARSRERERVQKVVRDRDQESVSQRKRRRMERCLEKSRRRDVEGGGDEDSSGPSGEEAYEEDYEEPTSSMSNHALRRTVAPIRNFRSMAGLRVADEMIGAVVPRRARSASVKRLNEQWNSGPRGFGEPQSRRRLSPSPLGGTVDIVSPPSSSVSLRRKMKPLGPKGVISKVSCKPLPSVEDDIEIEVVEALFDLMKQTQSQSSKKDERIRDNISTENLHLTGNKDFHTKSSPTICEQIGLDASDLPPEINSTSELSTESDSKFGKMSSDALERTEEVCLEKGKDSSEPVQESVGGDQVIVAKEEESRPCEKSNDDGSLDSTMSKANAASEVVMPKREANFEIDLMAPPRMPSSPDRDGTKIRVPDLKLDLEKPEQENASSCNCNNSEPRDPEAQNHCIASDSERQNFGQLNSLPSPVVATGWPGCFPPQGYMAPLKTLFPVDGSSRTTAFQLAPFTFSHPRSKRCVTHQYIACNIRQHQQLSKNCELPLATGPATLHGAKPSSGNPTTSTLNSFLGNPLQGDKPERRALVTPPALSVKGKGSEVANTVDASKHKQLVPQRTSEKAPVGNLLQPALIFPMHQAANVAAQQPDSDKSVAVMGKAALPNNSSGGLAFGSLSLPGGAAATSFNCANLSTNDASPFMAILQSNVHPYSTSTNSGMPLLIKGSQAPVLPLFNASFYPSVFCTPQNQQKQSPCPPQTKPLYQVQQASSTTGTSSSSASCSKQSKNRQQIVTQTSSHNSFGSEGLKLEQSQKQNVLGSHSSGKFVDNPGSHSQRAGNVQNYGIPFQTMNFASVSRGDGNQQQPGSDHSVAVFPPQAIGFSFDSNASTKLGINFSTLPQETAFAQMGYQFASSAQVAQNKDFQVAEKKNVLHATDTDEGRKALLAKSFDQSLNFSKLDPNNPSASCGKKVALDGSAQNQSSLPPLPPGSQCFPSSSFASTVAFSVTTPKSQQQHQQKEMIQLQKQNKQQMQLTGTGQVQAAISNNFGYSFIGCNNPNNNPIFSLAHNNNFVQSSQWKNASILTTTQVPSLATTSSLKNLPRQQSRNSQGQPHISFGSSLNSAMLFQGQHFLINSQPTSSIVDGHSSKSSASAYTSGSGSLKTTFGGNKARAAVAEVSPQQTELSSGPREKSVSTYGRDVPSILGACAS